jgi:hypothetical protein
MRALRPARPGAKDSVAGGRSWIVFADGKQFASREPIDGRLNGTLRDADAFRHLSVANLNRIRAPLLLGRKPQVNQEADWPTVVADQIAQKDIDNVIIQGKHRYISR